jgi:tRNA1(Val) A37 N6-methylase TrmN6
MDQVIDKKYDHIISCPPYYDLEIYGASEQQSTDLYKTYDDWLENYWRKTVIASKKLLNLDGCFAFIMGYHVRYQYMSRDMVEIAKQEGFKIVDEINIVPKNKPKNVYLSPIEKYEICSIFKNI